MSAKFKNGIDVNSQKITSVADPATTTDAATKNYVDTQDALNAKLASANTFTAAQTITNTAAGDSPLGPELITSASPTTGTWTAASSSALTTTGFTHVAGNTTPVTVTLSGGVTSGAYYQVAYTITGRTAGTVTIAIGGTSSGAVSASGAYGPVTTSTASPTITPTTDFNGTVVLSIKQINTTTAPFIVNDNNNLAVLEARTGGVQANNNTFVGRQAGQRNTTGTSNTAFGYNAGANLTSSSLSTAIGSNALSLGTTGGSTVAVGGNSLQNVTTGSTNTAVGAYSGGNVTSGSNNAFAGYQAGYPGNHSNCTFIGTYAGSSTFGQTTSLTNTIAIGYQAFTSATNQVAIGNTSITETRLQAPTVYGTNISLNSLAAPTISSTSTAATGGTLAQNTTYYYVMTSINAAGIETVQGTEQSRTTGNTTATNTITLNWAIVPGATSYRIYRSTVSGSYASASYYAISTPYTITYTDTNASASGTATPPTAPTGTTLTINPWSGQTGNAFAVNGAVAMTYRAITAARTLDGTDYTVDCTSAGFTVTLPTAVGITGRTYVIKNSASSGTITVATTSSQTIDGSSTKSLSTQYSSLVVQSTGANWIVIN